MKQKSFTSFISVLCFSLISLHSIIGQGQETKKWCLSQCNFAGDEKSNTLHIQNQCKIDSILNSDSNNASLVFPIRMIYINKENKNPSKDIPRVREVFAHLNEAFKPTGLLFYLDTLIYKKSAFSIETLSDDAYQPYLDFSKENDLPKQISLYVFNHARPFCQVDGSTVSCGRTGGFSFILSSLTNNIVLSQFDLDDPKVVGHEFGHFFGLYHTFEENQFGKDIMQDTCTMGDGICDTPADPGSFFDVYVNYSTCEMIGYKTDEGIPYKPIIQNYMSYYKPCYLKTYSFSPDQVNVMKLAGHSKLRRLFSHHN